MAWLGLGADLSVGVWSGLPEVEGEVKWGGLFMIWMLSSKRGGVRAGPGRSWLDSLSTYWILQCARQCSKGLPTQLLRSHHGSWRLVLMHVDE